jgi:hypothetical protein
MRTLAVCFTSATLVLAGCSGAAPSDLFGGPDGSSTPTPTPTTPVDPPPRIDAGDPPVVFDAGADASKPPIKDAGPDVVVVIDAGPPPPQVGCGLSSCPVSTQYCCNKWNGSAYVPACQNLGTTCSPGTLVYCDGKADCNGVCCGSLNTNGNYYTEVRCTQTCTGFVNNLQQVRFCDPKAMVDECQSLGLQCQASSLLTGYSVCR